MHPFAAETPSAEPVIHQVTGVCAVKRWDLLGRPMSGWFYPTDHQVPFFSITYDLRKFHVH